MSFSPEDALQHYTGGNLTVTGPRETASIFATYPSSYLSLSNGFLDQVSMREEMGKQVPTFALLVGSQAIVQFWVGYRVHSTLAPLASAAQKAQRW